MSEPSKTSAAYNKAMGSVKEGLGYVTGINELEAKGHVQKKEGEAEHTVADIKQKAEGVIDSIACAAKDTTGSLTSDSTKQAEGKTHQAKEGSQKQEDAEKAAAETRGKAEDAIESISCAVKDTADSLAFNTTMQAKSETQKVKCEAQKKEGEVKQTAAENKEKVEEAVESASCAAKDKACSLPSDSTKKAEGKVQEPKDSTEKSENS